MASFITAGNATNGLQVSSDNTGILELRTGTGSGTTAVTFSTGQRATFPSTISVGNTTPATTGAGITFPATQSASSDANTLDDYEEGDWTPSVQGQATAGTTTYGASRTGKYTKIGRQVNVWFQLDVTAATGTGAMFITGVPFASASTNQVAGAIMTWNLNWPGGTSVVCYIGASSTAIEIYLSGDDIAWLPQSVVNETFSFIGSITYFV